MKALHSRLSVLDKATGSADALDNDCSSSSKHNNHKHRAGLELEANGSKNELKQGLSTSVSQFHSILLLIRHLRFMQMEPPSEYQQPKKNNKSQYMNPRKEIIINSQMRSR